MPTVIIIGFQYNDLPSAITDIYKVYSMYRDLEYRIFMCSDIEVPQKPNNITSLLVSDSIDDKFIPFIEKDFVRFRHIVKTIYDMKKFLANIELTSDRRLLVYYTGHGDEGHLIMPNNTRYKSLDFRNDLLQVGYVDSRTDTSIGLSLDFDVDIPEQINRGIGDIGSQIFIVFDCCNPHGLYLPYKLNRENKKYIEVGNNFVSPEIILISSSQSNQKTQATLNESPFTKYLICRIKNRTMNYDLISLLDYIDAEVKHSGSLLESQTCSAYVSYPTLNILWSWVVTNKIDLSINHNLDSLIIRKRK